MKLRSFVWPNFIFFMAFFFIPLLYFMQMGFHVDVGHAQTDPGFSLQNFATFLSRSYFLQALKTTFLISFFAPLIATIIALPVAYELSRMSPKQMKMFLVILMAPNFVSVVIRSIGWVMTLGRNSPFNSFLGLFGQEINLLNTIQGVILNEVAYFVPLITLVLIGVFSSLQPELEQAAETLGARRHSVYKRVILPLILPGTIIGYLTMFSFSTGVYTSTVLMGGSKVTTLPILIYQEFITKVAYGMGSSIALLLLVLVFLVNILSLMYVRRITRYL